MGKYTFLLLIIILSGLTLLFKGNFSSVNGSQNIIALGPTPYPTITVVENYSVVKSDTTSIQTSRNIEVISPITNDVIKSGFAVKGNARVKNNTVVIRLLDSSGNILSETTAEANSLSSENYGPFEKLVYFNTDNETGKVEVFLFNTIDGTISDVVSVPLNFN